MPKITGGSVLCLQTYLRRTYGDDAYDRLLDALPEADGEALRGIILPVKWYPLPAFIGALDAAGARYGDEFFERYGSFAAEFEIHTFQRIALRFTSPVYLLERAGRMWQRFHDSGEWQVEGSEKHMRGTLRHFSVVSATHCRVVTAWIQRAAEMTGARGRVEHPECRAQGADACVFVGNWT